MKEQLLILNSYSFILHPSAFILALPPRKHFRVERSMGSKAKFFDSTEAYHANYHCSSPYGFPSVSGRLHT
jgi:hypothetical protein